MADVEGYREELSNLGSQWDLLTILGQMNGTGTDMTGTRQGFQRLTSELLVQLGLETLKKTIQEMGSKAQVSVDIVIRNLFERTADIGFLATDDDIRDFLRTVADLDARAVGLAEDDHMLGELRTQRAECEAGLVARFREYVAKYSVYFNIILMDTRGDVLAQLDADNPVRHSADPLVREALETEAEYVEVFRHSDLLESHDKSLIYAYRVTETNDPDSRPLGVLCLCFRFKDEMRGVFGNLGAEDDWEVMTLLDSEGRVIASSDESHIPLGARMDAAPGAKFKVARFAGREYLATTRATKGYQGFMGLGWYGHVMVPMDHAFSQNGSNGLRERVNQEILDAVMNDPRLFSEALRSIPRQADHIQHDLERTVWNGNVRENDGQSKVLLWNISDAGARTKMVFEQSIGNLHETVVSGILTDVEFQAALAVDIMDRNLYERANDCRWWALTSAFRRILSQREITPRDADSAASILAYINGLYTVYTNLFVYNASGRILAVSNPEEAHLAGTTLSEDWVRQTLALKDSQSYGVSPFGPTPLYADRHTYVYGAAITDPERPERCVGGIGIVFDSEPQFREMLLDSLPRDESGEIPAGCFGVFTDREGRVISSTDPGLPAGSVLDVDPEFLALPCGRGTSRIIELKGHYYAVGSRTSSGYREYKQGDGYENDVVAMVFVPLAEASERHARMVRRRKAGMGVSGSRSGGQDCIELATFYIGDKWFGINAERIREAINSTGLTTIPGMGSCVRGKLLYQGSPITVLDIRDQLGLPRETFDSAAPIVVVDLGGSCAGIAVDALGEIPEVCMDRVDTGCSILESPDSYVECIIKPAPEAQEQDLLVVLDPDRLVRSLTQSKN